MAFGVLVSLAVIILAALVAATAWGSHRRGRSNVTAVLTGLLFPFTWVAWYLVDERPYSR